eukprot:scaffold34862_cov15-Tisochrysis_lutea.AAC.1
MAPLIVSKEAMMKVMLLLVEMGVALVLMVIGMLLEVWLLTLSEVEMMMMLVLAITMLPSEQEIMLRPARAL